MTTTQQRPQQQQLSDCPYCGQGPDRHVGGSDGLLHCAPGKRKTDIWVAIASGIIGNLALLVTLVLSHPVAQCQNVLLQTFNESYCSRIANDHSYALWLTITCGVIFVVAIFKTLTGANIKSGE